MCGICGLVGFNVDQKYREEVVNKMNHSIYHRGPDDDGYFSDATCTLAMRRLSIIDLSSGKQPLYSDDKRYLIFFNGEVYNYRELKEELKELGCSFYTHSDTEVVVNMYKYFGKSMVVKLKGMFAFCIYDTLEKTYFFSRDRFGEKPFYYHYKNQQLVFSSELGSLINGNSFQPLLNREYLSEYIHLSYVREPNTLLQDVFTLPPGHSMYYDGKTQPTITSWFDVSYKVDHSIKTIDDAAVYIKPYLEGAVHRQMISDVSIGAFLSGGIDSSSVVAIMSKFSSQPVKTFTVKFQTEGYDESPIAKMVAKKWNTEHHEITVQNSGFTEDLFWRILEHVGQPFPDSSAIPTDMVTKEIAGFVKVALSGDGGDEVFGGYTVFDWIGKVKSFSRIPSSLSNLSSYLMDGVNGKTINSNLVRRISKVLKISGLPLNQMIPEIHALFDSKETAQLVINAIKDQGFEGLNKQDSLLRTSMKYRVKYDLPLDMLIKVDRMSMANSLEVRCPFLDPDLFEASCHLPDQFLRKGGLGKVVLRKIMENDLPEQVFNHPKSGFSIPLHDFRNDAFKQLAKSLLTQPYMKELMNEKVLLQILESGLNEKANDANGTIYRKMHQLWSLMMLSGWIKKYQISI